MKSLKIWSLAVVLLLAMVGCKPTHVSGEPNEEPTAGFDAIENEWKLVSVNGEANKFHVYIIFSDGLFSMYQQVYTRDFKLYEGQYSISDNKLTGEYFEGGAWKTEYTGGVSADGKTLTLKSTDENSITCVYEACVVPEEVKNEATLGTRAEEVVPFL